jgi:hypothetical protein
MLVDVVYPSYMPYTNLGVADDIAGHVQARGLGKKVLYSTPLHLMKDKQIGGTVCAVGRTSTALSPNPLNR